MKNARKTAALSRSASVEKSIKDNGLMAVSAVGSDAVSTCISFSFKGDVSAGRK